MLKRVENVVTGSPTFITPPSRPLLWLYCSSVSDIQESFPLQDPVPQSLLASNHHFLLNTRFFGARAFLILAGQAFLAYDAHISRELNRCFEKEKKNNSK